MGFFRKRSEKKPEGPPAGEAKPEAPAAKPDPEQLGIDGNRRALFRSIFSPVQAAVSEHKPVEENAGVILSKNPPQQRRVIRGSANAEVLALLGPLARGETVDGYRLERVTIGEQRIDVVFAKITGTRREDLKNVAITLNALDATEGQARWTTTSFRVCAAGDAPEPDMAAVTERVAREVAKVDRGQLWVVAASAPRGAQAQHHAPQPVARKPEVPQVPVAPSPSSPGGTVSRPAGSESGGAGDGSGAK